jgi:hypothetical protein
MVNYDFRMQQKFITLKLFIINSTEPFQILMKLDTNFIHFALMVVNENKPRGI